VLGRLSTRGYPDGGVEKFGYSARGMIAYTNQLGFTNFYAYDEAGRKLFETNANWEVIRYTNNAAGDLLALVDGKNQVTKWNYDEYGRVTNKLDQAGAEILRYKYDPDSRLTNRWSAAKGDTKYKYDPVGNLTNIDYSISTDVSFAYDPMNRMTNMIDAVGTTKYTYTAAGRLFTEDGPFTSDTVTNFYWNGLRTNLHLAQPTGKWTNGFAYDAAKRLTNVTSPAGAFDYTLGAASAASFLIKKLALPNTSYITNAYDEVARLRFTKLNNSSHSTLDSAEYGYNVGNQRTTFTNAAGTYVQYTNDPIGQLKIANSSVNTEDRGYAYDAAWNLNWRTNNGTAWPFETDIKNQLTLSPEGECNYDDNGNLVRYDGWSWNFAYDDENRLIAVEQEADFRSQFIYDGLGRLRKRIDSSWIFLDDDFGWSPDSAVVYVYDGMRVIQERDGNNAPAVSYTRGTDLSGSLEGAGGIGGLLARSHGYSSGNWSTHNFYHADGNGNITYLESSSQTLSASYRYDPFGNTVSSSGTLAFANSYQYSSKMILPAFGLYYYGYRWYAPNLQRWLTKDPLGEYGGVNLYQSFFNSPLHFVDRNGEDNIYDPKSGQNAPPAMVISMPVQGGPLAVQYPGRGIGDPMFFICAMTIGANTVGGAVEGFVAFVAAKGYETLVAVGVGAVIGRALKPHGHGEDPHEQEYPFEPPRPGRMQPKPPVPAPPRR
jgi:RHS repeat-associated protein